MLAWCKKKGVRLEEPSNLSRAYLQKADETLSSMHADISRDWKVTMAYYALYYALYAHLVKAGIRSENHACTILIGRELFGIDTEPIEAARQLRIDTQYFVDPSIPNEAYETLIADAPMIVSELVRSHTRLTSKRIDAIRKRFSED